MLAIAGQCPRRLFYTVSAGLLLVLAGCGNNEPTRYDLSGKVTWAGRPIPAGIMYFDPDIAGGHDGPQGYATITKGEYDTRKEGLGPSSGKYLVRLYAFDGVPGVEAPMGKPLFPEFSWTEDLPAENSVKDFNIPAAAARPQSNIPPGV